MIYQLQPSDVSDKEGLSRDVCAIDKRTPVTSLSSSRRHFHSALLLTRRWREIGVRAGVLSALLMTLVTIVYLELKHT